MPSGKRARQQRQQAAAAARTPPPVRSKGVGGARARQASPRALAIAGGVVLIIVLAVVLAVVLTGGKKSSANGGKVPLRGHHDWSGALLGSTDVYTMFKGIPEHGLILGNPNAPATLTEFIDLQCPVCRDFETTQMPNLIPKYVRTGKLNVRMEPWEILDRPGGPGDSLRGQQATIAASLQNRAFQFAQLLYDNQGLEDTGWLTQDVVASAAASVDGMDTTKIQNDQSSAKVKATISAVDSQASAQGYNATPTLLLNHKGQKAHVVSEGLPDAAKLQSQIEAAIRG
jgi:protein-disulfide isomerase